MTLRLRVVSRSEVGLVRKNNQDSGYASPHLLVVADGMGGAAAGDLASAVAIDSVRRLDTADLRGGPETAGADAVGNRGARGDDGGGTEDTLIVSDGDDDHGPGQGAAGQNPLLSRFAEAIAEANSRIADLVAADYSLEGMGTTVTGAVFDGSRLALAHIGDSRAYLLRDGVLERLTHDHSWVQSLVDEGRISSTEAAYHPHRSLLLKVLNGQAANDPDLTSVALRAGDRVLFCSDGLCGLVDDPEIGVLTAVPDLEQAVSELVDAALAAGGIDNITVILAEAVEGTEPAAGPVASTGHEGTGHGGTGHGGTGQAGAGSGAGDPDDTAIRSATPAATVLGAAAERQIPSAPHRAPLRSAMLDADADDLEDEDDEPVGEIPERTAETLDDESRYSPGPPAKRRIVRTLLVGLAIVMVTAAGLGAGYAWTRTQYFVGAADGQVAIYQGLPDGIPGLQLAEVYEVQDLPVTSLPAYYQAQVSAGIEVSDVDAARATVEQLKAAVRRCAEPTPTPKPTTPASESKTPKPSDSDSPLPGPTVPATTAPTPAPTPSLEC